MKLLTFTTLFPNPQRPQHGIFTDTSLRQLLATKAVSTRVVAPIPWFPFKGKMFGRYAAMAACCDQRHENGMQILHPRFAVLPKIGQAVAPLLLARAMKPVFQRILDSGYAFDLIDAHYFYPDGVAAALLGRHFNKPVVIKALGSDINVLAGHALSRRAIVWAANQAAAVTTVSNALKSRLITLGIEAGHITTLRNGVDLVLFKPVDRVGVRRMMGLAGFTLLSVGNLIESKGHHLAIEALTLITDATLIIAGSGPERTRLGELARRLGVFDRVEFAGSMDQAQLVAYYGAADALVLASRREGWANVLLESMACGTPVIASAIAGNTEVVGATAAGVLFRELSASGLAAAIAQLRANPPCRDATRRYADQFSWNAPTQDQIGLYERVLGRPPPQMRGSLPEPIGLPLNGSHI